MNTTGGTTRRPQGLPAASPPEPEPHRARQLAAEGLNRYGLLLVFAVVLILFSALRPSTFPTLGNFQSISSTQGVVALLALAAMLPLVVGQFDVSIGFQLGLSQTLCAGLIIKSGWPVGLAIAAAVLACCVVGVCNGLLVTRLRLPSFIATLGVGTVVLGLTQLYGSDETISGVLPSWFTGLGRNYVAEVPLPFIYVLAAAAVLWIAFEYTAWGRESLATGGNPKAALLAGVRTDRLTFQCFVAAGLLSGLAGVLSVTILGASAPTVGLGELLPAYAAAFLGATAIRPGRFNAIGTVVAVYLLATGITGLQMLGAEYYVQQLFNGGALLIALTLSSLAAGRSRAAA
ncbi:MAG: ABC transporter permease [Actinobacteria bacterium]|nr:ABC transporter permease [Actinomycetota bacterium]